MTDSVRQTDSQIELTSIHNCHCPVLLILMHCDSAHSLLPLDTIRTEQNSRAEKAKSIRRANGRRRCADLRKKTRTKKEEAEYTERKHNNTNTREL